ncbi:MAG: transcriptional repressor [Planctomycetales bacterium]|nr:transcriptional repressor [Planctomycetales bacterium]
MHTHEHQFDLEKKIAEFETRCRQKGLRITPQRVAVYKALVGTDTHPTAEEVHKMVRQDIHSISLDTVNRTLLTLAEIGAAFQVEGTGQPRRYDGGLENHQHFRCISCGQIVDFHYDPYENLHNPGQVLENCTILRKTVYLEGLCGECSDTPA